MKPEQFISNEISVKSPDRAERAILVVILGVYWPVHGIFSQFTPFFVLEEPLCDTGTPS